MKWTELKNKKPPLNKDILVYGSYESALKRAPLVAYYDGTYFIESSTLFPIRAITHWCRISLPSCNIASHFGPQPGDFTPYPGG